MRREYGFTGVDPKHYAHLHWFDTKKEHKSTFTAYDPAEATRQAYRAAVNLGANTSRPWSFRIDHQTERVD